MMANVRRRAISWAGDMEPEAVGGRRRWWSEKDDENEERGGERERFWRRERSCKKRVNIRACRKPSWLFGKCDYCKFMLSLIPYLTVSIAIAYVFAWMRMFTAAIEAPVGYEDEEGFHYGVRVADRSDR